jgi:uncharacterized tellurite resistance protein B-like protein
MGIIDKVRGQKYKSIPPKTALCLAALTVIAADGNIGSAESSAIEKIVGDNQQHFGEACKIFETTTYEDCIELVARSLTEEQQTALIAILLDLAIIDETLRPGEKKLIMEYVLKFGIPPKTFQEMCHYILMRHNLALFDNDPNTADI